MLKKRGTALERFASLDEKKDLAGLIDKQMKILHVGGYHSLTLTFAKEQLKLGHEVTVMDTCGAEYFFEMPFACLEVKEKAAQIAKERYEIIQFHSAQSLFSFADGAALETTLKTLKSEGAKLLLYTYGEDSLAKAEAHLPADLSHRLLRESFDFLFIGSPDNMSFSSLGVPWGWLAMPLDLETIPAEGQPAQNKKGELSFLHIPYRVPKEESDLIIEIMAALKGKGYRFNFKLVSPNEIIDGTNLLQTLADCNVYIEHLSKSSFGLPALKAMALGKTVLSGNSQSARQSWEQLSVCPILDTSSDNFERRVESILREPRCIKDLGRRSRRYVEAHHNAAIINRMVLDTYQRVLAGPRRARNN